MNPDQARTATGRFVSNRRRQCSACRQVKYASAFKGKARRCRACAGEAKRERAAQLRYWTRHGRECAECGERVPYPEKIKAGRDAKCVTCRRKTKAATARRWRANHPEASAAASVRWRRTHPEKARETDRRYFEAIKADPERATVRLVNRRINAHLRRPEMENVRAAGHAADAYYAPPRSHETPLLDAEPLAAWLRWEFGSWPTTNIARRLGVDEATVRRLMSGHQRVVSLFTADRMFVGADCTHLLAVLYPDERASA